MARRSALYRTARNPLLIAPGRPLPAAAAVIGAGTIGPDIGYYLKSAMPACRLVLVDVAEAPLKRAEQRIADYTAKAVEKRKMRPEQAAAVRENIIYTTDYGRIRDCGLVIEAATENIPLKHQIFAAVEEIVTEDAVITSNTSSIPAARLFDRLRRPERATVTHFFAPAWRSLPVEVVNWPRVAPEVLDYLFWFFARTGKAPIITADAICFVLDRIFDNWCNEAAFLLAEATAAQIDRVAEEFVFAGPFFVLNLANGNPIIVETNTLQMEEGRHYRPAPILQSVDRWLTRRPGTPVEVPEKSARRIRDRLLGILFSQTVDIVDRGIGTPEDVNFGCQVALGFRQGPLDLMAQMGAREVARIMKKFSRERPGFPQPRRPLPAYQDFRRFVLVDEVNGVKVITIRRPQAMNALNDAVTDEILAVLQAFADDPKVKGFVITGYGTAAFSAGADIGRFPRMLGKPKAAAQYARDCAKVQAFMDRLRKPVVAAVNGFAMGGGLELAIRCHRIVATANAVLQFPEITLGILPGIGGCVVPYRRWPQAAQLFHEMICAARPLKAAEAQAIGIVSRIADDAGHAVRLAVEEVESLRRDGLPPLAEEPVALPPLEAPEAPRAASGQPLSREAVAVTVRTIAAAAAKRRLKEALEVGYRGFGEIACTEAAREGIAAFLEKRRPEFRK
jgi:enoyl-CoA hydratase/3-hydroxyacyl-CoA dehydrogenase